jgi:hypothetical protein
MKKTHKWHDKLKYPILEVVCLNCGLHKKFINRFMGYRYYYNDLEQNFVKLPSCEKTLDETLKEDKRIVATRAKHRVYDNDLIFPTRHNDKQPLFK